MEMQMTDDEIRGSMRKAADPAAQVQILAELNACGEDQMRDKLQELGVEVPARQARKPGRNTHVDLDRIKQLYGQGLSDKEIAVRMGCSSSTVFTWRKAHSMPPNAKPFSRRGRTASVPGPVTAPAVPAAETAGTTTPAADVPALCGPAEVVPVWAVTVGGRPALYLSRRALADAVQAIIDLDVELRRCRDGKDDH